MKHIYAIILLIFGFILTCNSQKSGYSLDFDEKNYTTKSFTLNNVEYRVRAYENIIYVSNPIDTNYQKMNIYIPEEYFNNETVNKYDKKSAPILFPNGIGGYMSSLPLNLYNNTGRNIFGLPMGERPLNTVLELPNGANLKSGNIIQYALSKGYVVASAGARGRELQNNEGVYIGKAPAGLVDLKAAVRYLRYNDKKIPGDKNKIISNGTSAGGAMSTLLGATGNSIDYLPYLKEIGAANMPDDIFAVSAYCPITDLDHADCAYEWQFNGVNSFKPIIFNRGERGNSKHNDVYELSELEIKTSNELKTLFPIYLNSLNLKDENGNSLTVNEQGNGTFKDFVIKYVLKSAQKAINEGDDLSNTTWLTIRDDQATNIDWESYINYMTRMKTPPAFDAFNLDKPENHLFGTVSINAQHFTDFSYNNAPDRATMAEESIIKMMNPLYYINRNDCSNAKHWHIRYGTIDNNTSLAIEVIIATILQNNGFNVDFAFAWNRPHVGDYDLEELFNWLEDIQ